MLRHHQGYLNSFIVFAVAMATGIFLQFRSEEATRSPAAATDFKAADFDHATLAVSLLEFQNSRPQTGRSYFDQIFSLNDQYNVPYPFNQILNRLADYTGQKINSKDSSGLKVTLFPMGRSLQRSAAIVGLNQAFSFDPFFRFPRVVVGIDEEPAFENSLLLNLKNKFYIGFNERAQILEVISYNEDEGRYEYQIVRDYAAGRTPQVVYANRSLCLSCHQNQTPIFSRGPWSESNANPEVSQKLYAVMDAAFGKPACVPGANQPYCYQNQEAFYFGAPLKVEQSIPYKFDTSTDLGNLTHAYQKMWKELCITSECRVAMLKAIIVFRLTGQAGIVPENSVGAQLQAFENQWTSHFPNGLAIPSPNIPNRNPLKDVVATAGDGNFATVNDQNRKSVQQLLAQSKIPTEFEPLQPRQPLDIWKTSGLNATNTNQLIKGLSQEFTSTDIRMIDQWLSKNKGASVVQLQAGCEVDPDGANLVLTCTGKGPEAFSFNAYVKMTGNEGRVTVSDLTYKSKTLNCGEVPRTEVNLFKGLSCPAFTDLVGLLTKTGNDSARLILQKGDGLSLRNYQGHLISEIRLDLKNKSAVLEVFDQTALIDSTIVQNQQLLFRPKSFSRMQIMRTLLAAGQMKLTRVQDLLSPQFAMAVENEAGFDDLREQMNGFTLMKNVCAHCHQNNEAVPPNFMGTISSPSTDFEQCRRIEQCAPRMLYRLKMRRCDQASLQKKKNPMPPNFYFKNNTAATAEWMNIHNPKILKYLEALVSEPELAQELSAHGLASTEAQRAAGDILRSDCPESNSVIYDQLPKCEFNQMKATTRCR